MKLIDALRVDSLSRISLVGSGGKTSALIRLGREWSGMSLAAATAHIGIDQIGYFTQHLVWIPDQPINRTIKEKTIITGPRGERNMLHGVDPSQWGDIEKLAENNGVPLFMESDGSKTRPLKAPAEHEPAIPAWANHVVVVVGLSVVGKLLHDANVHRAELFSSITGLDLGRPVTLHSIVKMLSSSQGGLKNIPRQARKTVILNQMDLVQDKSSLLTVEKQLLAHYDAVISASLQASDSNKTEVDWENEVSKVDEKIAGIILAAGNSRRMGHSKAMLEWKGIPFVRECALQAITAGLNPIHIIAGQDMESIQASVKDLPVTIIQNPDWNEGQASSIRTGIKSLPRKIGGAVFLLVDQPQIPVTLIRKLIAEHSTTISPIVLPIAGGRRANPVLFDRKTFPSLSNLQGDIGGRMIFSQFPIHSFEWFDESILLDVDTPEDYQRLLDIQ
jgi:molybdenum cofactor cytidylyltransferase